MRPWRTLAFVIILGAAVATPAGSPAQEAPKPGPVVAEGSGSVAQKEGTGNRASIPAAGSAEVRPADDPREHPFEYFAFLSDPSYGWGERAALIATLLVAVAGLCYAGMLVSQVIGADQGTVKMREVADAVAEGAWAYLMRQLKVISLLVIGLTVVLYSTSEVHGPVATGRAAAFFLGALFSWIVGFVGMNLAVRGNLRVAAAARTSYGGALQLGYRTGTITGMLTDGLGLLGGTVIFMAYGEHAYEVLLGFGFGATLLALFMRVGGGIYTKAADVGADLVGKVEAGVPEDDPRNAATIADNVGDNVGDCAGMAADIFESYEVTIVAAMILGYASFGHKGVIFPLLVRAIGVFGSIWSTYTVKAGPDSTADEALHSVHRGFILGSIASVFGFMLLGVGYLHFDDDYIRQYPQAIGGYTKTDEFTKARSEFREAFWADYEKSHARERREDNERYLDAGESVLGVKEREFITGYKGKILADSQPFWANLGWAGLDLRPAWTCLIGIILAITLNKVTSYYTHTEYAPVKSIAKASQTGHATNIIHGLAVGYESAVVATLVIVGAILISVMIYAGSAPIFIAYGIAMCGIGMLTLTGNTISMDVFGPVADNANGIGEMGYDREEMGEENYKRARKILADLDAVGNTTKAETKGIAIGSAVMAALSLFASFIAVMAVKSETKIGEMTTLQYLEEAGKLSFAYPAVFVGALIGGAVPLLFSSMLIRAVGRAAFLIVKECRVQFRDKAIWEGTKKPDYGRVVNICTSRAQSELVGPALIAILMPITVGIYLGPQAMGGFLAGMIIVGQLLAVFMANAGGAWDNAKKTIEDGHYGGKGSEAHKASVTGDTVGDPLKDTAGPALNPLINVMNMVSLLAIVPIMTYHDRGSHAIYLIGLICVAGIAWAVWRSKTESRELRDLESDLQLSDASALEGLQEVGSSSR